jgi:cell division protein FtsB
MTETDGQPEQRRRSNLTGRAAVLALVVCLLAISLAYPLREYLSQRSDISEYRARVAEQEARVAELRAQHERWEDNAYVEAQARERLHYVMPGETSYVVLEADEAPPQDGVVEAQAPDAARSPWFTDLWNSVEAAGGDPKTSR